MLARGLQRQENNTRSPGNGVTSGCDGIQTRVLCKSKCTSPPKLFSSPNSEYVLAKIKLSLKPREKFLLLILQKFAVDNSSVSKSTLTLISSELNFKIITAF